jgi:hypothetical protein
MAVLVPLASVRMTVLWWASETPDSISIVHAPWNRKRPTMFDVNPKEPTMTMSLALEISEETLAKRRC